MTIEWVTDDRGRIVAPVSTGFSLAGLKPPLVAVQLRCEKPHRSSDSQDEGYLQFQISVAGARDLAAALLQVAQLIEDAPEVGRLN